jgi:hypothetical protein
MNAHTQRLLALRQDLPLNKKQSIVKQGVVFSLFKSTQFYITLALVFVILITNIGVAGFQTKSDLQTKLPEWIEAISTIKDFSYNSRQDRWGEVREDIKNTVSPAFSYVGISPLIEYDIDRVFDHIQQWHEYSMPLYNYTIDQNGFSYIGPGERFFTDDLEIFLSEGEKLLPETRNLIRSMWYYRLAGMLSFNEDIITALRLLDTGMEIIASIIANKDQILDVLGHSLRQTYLVFNQNNGEARPTGGFIGSNLTFDFVKGMLEISESESIYLTDDNKPNPIKTHPVISHVSINANVRGVEGGLRNLNYFSCFPDTARMIHREWKGLGTESIDSQGVIFLSTTLLVDLLPDNFIIDVPTYGTFNSQNIINELERITSFQPQEENFENLKRPLGSVMRALIEALPRIIEQKGIVSFFNTLLVSLRARNLMVWFENSFIQDLLNRFELDGSQTCGKESIISPVQINITADKRDNIISNEYALTSRPVWGGYEITLVYSQKLPSSIYLPRGFNNYNGRYFFGLQLPQESWDISIASSDPFDKQAVDEFYDLYLENRYGQTIHTPEEFQIIYDSISDKDLGYTYLQPDGTKVAGTLIWTDEDRTDVTITFKVPHSIHDTLAFYGQPGINSPQLSLGDGVRFVDTFETVTSDRFEIQKGVDIVLT